MRRYDASALGLGILGLVGALLACKSPLGKGTGDAGATTAAPDPPVTRNVAVDSAVRAMTRACTYDRSKNQVTCGGGEHSAAVKAAEALPANDPTVLETLSDLAAHDPDLKVVTFAALLMSDLFKGRIRPALDPEKNPNASAYASPATARRLLASLPRVPKLVWHVYNTGFVVARARLQNEAMRVIDALPAARDGEPDPHRAGYSGIVLALGGEAVPVLDHYAASDPASAVSTLYDLGKLSSDAAATLCPWVTKHVSSSNEAARASAIEVTAISCPVAGLEAPVKALERGSTGKVAQSFLRPYQRVAERLGADSASDPSAKALGRRVHDVAVRLTRDESQDRGTRYMAVYMLSGFDDDQTLGECETESRNSRLDAMVREELRNCAKRIRSRRSNNH